MKNGVNKTVSVLTVILMLLFLFPGSIWGEEIQNTEKPNSAAINPAFIQYMDELENGTISGLTAGGHSRGYIPSPLKRFEDVESIDGTQMNQAAALPAAYDLRSTGRISAVRDQDPYGSCWAFASYASMESYLKKDTTADLSENNMMWNNGFDGGFDSGGNCYIASAYLARWSGPVSESSDPYGSIQKTGLAPVYHVQEVNYISKSQTDIKQALIENGALDMAMYSGALDDDTYYDSNRNSLYYNGNEDTDHDVAIVGWDDNYDRNNFTITPPGNGAWIIRNSWGKDWGENGYFYMSYYDTYAGEEVAAFHNAETTSNYTRNYQYDPLGNTSAMGYDNVTTVSGGNIYTAAANENLSAVSTYALSNNTTCIINVYTNVNSGQPTNGTLKSTKTVTIPKQGYYTVPLDTAVGLTVGQKFSVVIKYTTPGNFEPVPVEKAFANYSSAASANPGESFLSKDGSNWFDISAADDANVCIKAFTTTKSMVLQSIAISTPASKLSYGIGDSLDLSGLVVMGTYSDGTKKTENISAQNITGFDSSKAASNQVLTINVNGKTTTYTVTIKDSTITDSVNAVYRTHVQNQGWQSWKYNGAMSGTTGQSLRLEGIQIKSESGDYDLGFKYATHVENIGWQAEKTNGLMSGTSGQSLRLEAIMITLTGADANKFDVYYHVHAQNVGWMGWAKNGAQSGTAGFGYRLEGIEIQVVPKGDPAPGSTEQPFLSNN